MYVEGSTPRATLGSTEINATHGKTLNKNRRKKLRRHARLGWRVMRAANGCVKTIMLDTKEKRARVVRQASSGGEKPYV